MTSQFFCSSLILRRAVTFAAQPAAAAGTLVLPLSAEADLATRGASLSDDERAAIGRALTSADFNYRARQTLSLRGIGAWDRIFVIGLGDSPTNAGYQSAGAVTGRALLSEEGGVTVMADPALAKPPQPAARPIATPKVKPFELDELTLAELQAGLRSGRFSALSLAKKYLARIEALDQASPTLKAVIEINPDALAVARDLDAERKARGPRGPLPGVPILIKDNLDTHDRMPYGL